MSRRIFLVTALVLAVFVAHEGKAQANITTHARNPKWAVPVDSKINLYKVSPTLYRCGQFAKEDVPELEKLGIRTSVDLRYFHSDSEFLQGSSIQPVRVRTNTWNIGDPAVIAALAAIRRGEKYGPVLLHCHHGSDRTGLIVAMYRLVYQGWTKEEALDELRSGGYGYNSLWENIPAYIQHVDVERIHHAVDQELMK